MSSQAWAEAHARTSELQVLLLSRTWHYMARHCGVGGGAPTMAVTSLLYTQSRCCADTTSRNRPKHSVLFMVTCSRVSVPCNIMLQQAA